MKQYKHESEQAKGALEVERSKQDARKEEVRFLSAKSTNSFHFSTARFGKDSKRFFSISIKLQFRL